MGGRSCQHHGLWFVYHAAVYRYQVLLNPLLICASNIATATTPPRPRPRPVMTAEIPGDLVNVSVRGQITNTDTTIIPGFVVANGRVRVLVRVIGPTIGAPPYNVPGTCPDPRFEVRNSAGVVVASNDNWSGQEVIDASAATGAFALPAGSKDAAVVVTLPPGNYTVVARANTGDGLALAEAYRIP
jgi:hypothetical protein